MSTQVALLRGINVGGHRKLPMAELRELCLELGWKDVRTYIQSGNVVFRANRPDPDALAGYIRDRFAVVGSEVHLNCPNGSARTKLTVDWFEGSLGVRATARNWRTLERLIELSFVFLLAGIFVEGIVRHQ